MLTHDTRAAHISVGALAAVNVGALASVLALWRQCWRFGVTQRKGLATRAAHINAHPLTFEMTSHFPLDLLLSQSSMERFDSVSRLRKNH